MNQHLSVSTRNKLSERLVLNRRTFGAVAAGALSAGLAGPAIVRAKPAALVVADQGGSELEFMKTHVIPYFEKETGVPIKYIVGTHPDRFIRLRSEVPNPSFHVYFSKFDFVSQAIQFGLLEQIDEKLIPGFERIAPNFRTPYSAGFVYTAEVLLYNPKTGERPTSWGVLWDPKFTGKIGINPFIDRNLMIASLYATKGERIDDEEKAWPLLEKMTGELRGKVIPGSEQTGQMFEQGEVAVTNFWQARAVAYREANQPVDYVAPREGTVSESWAFGIPKGTPPELKDLAGVFIGIATSDRVAVAYAKDAGYPGCKPDVVYPPEIQKNLLTPAEFNAMKSPNYTWIIKNRSQWENRWKRMLTR